MERKWGLNDRIDNRSRWQPLVNQFSYLNQLGLQECQCVVDNSGLSKIHHKASNCIGAQESDLMSAVEEQNAPEISFTAGVSIPLAGASFLAYPI